MKKLFFSALMCFMTLSISAQYVDLGLPSGTQWATTNSNFSEFYTYDQAIVKFGQNLPSKAQWEELIDYCNWTWTGRGYKIVGPNEKSIFLPAEGRRKCNGNEYKDNTLGYYWSSELEDKSSDDAYHFAFGIDWYNVSDQDRCEGHSIRLVK